MSQLTVANYANATPLATDSLPFVQIAANLVKTVTVQGLADVLASLASQNVTVSVVSITTVLTTQQMLVVNAAGATNQTLPASSLNSGRTYYIANKGAGTVTVLPNGTDTIEGAASIALAQYATATLRSDGLGMWHRFSV